VASGIGDITVTRLSADFKALESQKVISVGNGCEGSHMYHIGDYYYIYATYGGTEGSQTIFRAKSPMGPYEEHPTRVFANQHIHQGALGRRRPASGGRCSSKTTVPSVVCPIWSRWYGKTAGP
jgi:beta-xylosidase